MRLSSLLGLVGCDDPFPFADRKYLIGPDIRESLNFECRRPLYFDSINYLRFTEPEVQAKIALRHNAGSAADFVHLHMLPGDDTHASADCRAVASGSEEFEFDPVLLVATVVAQQRRHVIHVKD